VVDACFSPISFMATLQINMMGDAC